VDDSAYLPLQNSSWAYLAAVQAVYSKRVVGWQVLSSMPEALVTTVLHRAPLSRQPASGLVGHAAHGRSYWGKAYGRLLPDRQLVRSRSRRGACYDNAQAKSLWSRVRTGVLLDRSAFCCVARASAELAVYFGYCNHQRRPSALSYECPDTSEQKPLSMKAQLCLT
jgi:putative transposase